MGFQCAAKVENKWSRQGVAKPFRVISRMANLDINIQLNNYVVTHTWTHLFP